MAIYYVSADGCDRNDGQTPQTAFQSIQRVNEILTGGDTVQFRRGDTFYGQLRPPRTNTTDSPTTYTAYGEGPKPVISQYKTALPHGWETTAEDVWRLDLTNPDNLTGNVTELNANVGFLKVDGRIKPVKRLSLQALADPWDFYCDDRYVYVKSAKKPSDAATDIKLACMIICMGFADNLVVEQLVFTGTGGHGIAGSVHHAIIRDCEFHEIGGSELLSYPEPGVRFGNGVECWTDSSDVLVEGCRFSGIYDVAITMQGSNVTSGWVDMTFRNNVIWNCQQAFEVWSAGELPGTGFQNCLFENNVCIDSGYCWGSDVRPNKNPSCHLLLYNVQCPLCDITVRHNTFYNARVTPIYKSKGPQEMPEGYRIIDNVFMIEPGQDIFFREDGDEQAYAALMQMIASQNTIVER